MRVCVCVCVREREREREPEKERDHSDERDGGVVGRKVHCHAPATPIEVNGSKRQREI